MVATPLKIEAILFDCDGVLVDTENLKFISWQRALHDQGIEFTLSDYMPLIGYSSKAILKQFSHVKGIEIPEKVIQRRHEEYAALQQEGVPIFNEAVECVRELFKQKKQLGIKMGLASSATQKEIMTNLKNCGLEYVFDLIISGSEDLDAYHDLEGKNKPKPYIYLESAKRLGVEPAHCIVFEDTTAGVEAAVGAHMIAIAVPNQFTRQQDFSKARYKLSSVSDFFDF